MLYRTCGHHALLPGALKVPVCYNRTSNVLYKGGYADVWKGKYCGQDMAVKVVRTYSSDDLRKIINVGCTISGYFVLVTTFYTELLPRSRDGEIPSTSQCPAITRCIHVRESVRNGVRMDAKREYQSIRRSTSRSEQVQPRTSSVFNLAPVVLQLKSLQLVDVVNGLIYLHSNGMVHGNLKGVSFRSLELFWRLDKFTHQGEHTDRRNRSSPPGRLRSTHDCLGPCKCSILELVCTRRHSPVDESRANRPRAFWF